MKKLIIALLIVSCNTTPDIKSQILGKWYTQSNKGGIGYFIFDANGEVELSSIKLQHRLKWDLINKTLLLSHNGKLSDSLIISYISDEKIIFIKPLSRQLIELYRTKP